MAEAAASLYDRRCGDGWDVDGARRLCLHVDWNGAPVVRERMHWVDAEAIGAAAALLQAQGDPRYERDYAAWWELRARLPASIERWGRGGTNSTRRTTRRHAVWEGKPDLYHALQATLIPRLAADARRSRCLSRRGTPRHGASSPAL